MSDFVKSVNKARLAELPSDEWDDVRLLQAIAAFDQQALKLLYARHATAVYAFVNRRLTTASAADEVTNDTFLQAWRSASSFEGRSSAKTWLYGIAKNKVMDALRSHYRVADHEQPELAGKVCNTADAAPGPYEQALSRQKGKHLAECFEALSPDHRECMHLSFVEGMTLQEISKVVDAPSNTVGTRIHHAKHKLKACLEGRLGVGEVL